MIHGQKDEVVPVNFSIKVLSIFKKAKKKMIIVKNSYITRALSIFINIKAITIWPFIIISGESNKILENHEKVHIKQQEELLLIGFYILYVYYWIKNLFRFYGYLDYRQVIVRKNFYR